jgi:hypothetical protein
MKNSRKVAKTVDFTKENSRIDIIKDLCVKGANIHETNDKIPPYTALIKLCSLIS